ncbi:MAG: glycosyltransferase family 4 protein, partial [Microcoleaceae cyanobacterium]
MLSKEQAKKLKILMVVEQCNPDWVSVPLVGYKFYREVNQLAEVTLVTHARNRKAFANCPQHHPVIFIEESQLNILYHKLAVRIAAKGRKDLAKGVNWPLYHLLAYPVYAEFNYKVYQRFKSEILSGHYDIVHALTPIMPRYPFKVCQLCKQTPFILGPVNGGIPFPAGFAEKAKQENSYLNFLRAVGRYLIPGYVATYKRADKVLSGSSYTLSLLKKLFRLPEQKMALFYENGIEADTLTTQPKSSKEGDEQINLLFVGRLVPYKCADVVIRAVNQLKASVKYRAQLTIVGDGSERETLKALVQSLGLDKQVQFTGFVPQATVSQYYGAADIFCFPSIREFGGAVVLEAMAHGLP